MTDERYKKIMADLGMPNSRSLLDALRQVANEVGQACPPSSSIIYTSEIEQLRQQLATVTADRDRLLEIMGEIAGSKSLTATPTQFYQYLQRVASDATITNPEALAATEPKQVATLQELKQAWHDKFWEQSKETNQLRKQLAEAQTETINLQLYTDKRIKELEHKLVLREAQWKRKGKEKGE